MIVFQKNDEKTIPAGIRTLELLINLPDALIYKFVTTALLVHFVCNPYKHANPMLFCHNDFLLNETYFVAGG